MLFLYADCQYAECRILFIITLIVTRQCGIMLNVVVMNVVAPTDCVCGGNIG
jgi:hypothetical protein